MEKGKADQGGFLNGKAGIRRICYILLGLLALVVLYRLGRKLPVAEVVEAIGDLGAVPFFVGMALLPVVGFPVTPFYLLAGATFGVWGSLAGTAASQAANLAISYWVARRYLRKPVERLVRSANYIIPEVAPRNHVAFTVLVKITPGPPNFLKSFLLGLARIPFKLFLVVSWPITMSYAVGVIIFGDSLVERDWSQAVIGLVLMAAFLVGIRVAAGIYRRQRGEPDPVKSLKKEASNTSGTDGEGG